MERRTSTLVVLVAVALATVAGGGIAAGDGIADESSVDASNAVATQAECSYPVSVTDTTGTEVALDERPERIVALQPSDAQILWEIGAADRVVGMDGSPATDYLNDTEGVTNVKNDDGTVDVEEVTNLSADLVLAANVTQSGTIDQLRNTNATVHHFGQVESMAATYRNINRTGELVGSCEAAGDRVAAMQERLDRIESAVADRERPGVLYLFYGYTAGNATHIGSMIESAGGENIAASEGLSGYPEISEEIVTVNDPEWIVQPSDAPAVSGAPYNSTTAVTEGQVLRVNTNYVNQAGPRVVNVVETMAQEFHPEAFDENGDPIVETATATPMDTATPSGSTADGEPATTEPDGGTATPTSGSGPGFTPVTVVLALVAAAVGLGVRRKGV